MFSCEFCELFKNTCFVEDLQTAGSETPDRISRPDVFCEKGVLGNFAKFTRRHLCQSLFFNKFAGGRPPANLLKKRLWHRCLLVNFAKFPRTPFSQNTSGRLILSGVSEPAVCRSSTKQVFLNNSQNSQENTYVSVTFLRRPCFTEHLQWLFLKVSVFQPATSL